MIKVSKIVKSYSVGGHKHMALRGVDLAVNPGKILGIVGASGAGKSTLVRALNLLDRPDEGSVSIDGTDLCSLSPTALREARRQIGMIFQHFHLVNAKTVAENIAMPLRFEGLSAKDAQERVDRLLRDVGLPDFGDRYPAQLSGGQKQRVAIARALALNPKVLLCDEATSALDPQSTTQIIDCLRRLRDERRITIVFITHEMHVVKSLCDEVAILEAGRIVERGSVLDVFAKPQTEVGKQFVAQCLHMRVPDLLKSRLTNDAQSNSTALYKVTYVGEITSEPLLSQVVKEHQVLTNILLAHIETVQEQTLGQMMILFHGEAANVQAAIHFLSSQGLHIERVGYVRSDS